MTKHISDPDELITLIIAGIEDIKGQNISILDLRSIENSVCDYFMICDGNSNTQVNAIVNSYKKKSVKALMKSPIKLKEKKMQNGY